MIKMAKMLPHCVNSNLCPKHRINSMKNYVKDTLYNICFEIHN